MELDVSQKRIKKANLNPTSDITNPKISIERSKRIKIKTHGTWTMCFSVRASGSTDTGVAAVYVSRPFLISSNCNFERHES